MKQHNGKRSIITALVLAMLVSTLSLGNVFVLAAPSTTLPASADFNTDTTGDWMVTTQTGATGFSWGYDSIGGMSYGTTSNGAYTLTMATATTADKMSSATYGTAAWTDIAVQSMVKADLGSDLRYRYGLLARYTSSSSFYALRYNPGSQRLEIMRNSMATYAAQGATSSVNLATNTWYALKLTVVGSVVTGYWAPVNTTTGAIGTFTQGVTYTDSSPLVSGTAGMFSYTLGGSAMAASHTLTFDNISLTSLSPQITCSYDTTNADVSMKSATQLDDSNASVAVIVKAGTGTVRASTLSTSDVTVTGLPAGITVGSVTGDILNNKIIIALSGTAASPQTANANFSIIVNSSAVVETGYKTSDAVTVRLRIPQSQLLHETFDAGNAQNWVASKMAGAGNPGPLPSSTPAPMLTTAWSNANGAYQIVTDANDTVNDYRNLLAYNDTNAYNWKDCSIQATFTSPNITSSRFGLRARVVDNFSFYVFMYDSTQGNYRIMTSKQGGREWTDGVYKTISPNTTYTLKMEVVGSTIYGYSNGELVAIKADTAAPIIKGTVGLYVAGASKTMIFDDIQVSQPATAEMAIDNATISGSGANATLALSLRNLRSTVSDKKVIVLTYDSTNILSKITISDITATATGSAANSNIPLTLPAGSGHSRIFIWDTLENIKSLSAVEMVKY